MKKIGSITALVLLVWSCSHKMTPAKTETPSTNSGMNAPVNDKSSATTNTTATTSTTASTSTTSTSSRNVDRTATGPDATVVAGQSTYNTKCGRCHGLKIVADYTVDRWISIMQVMAMKANLSDTEKQNVLAYVETNAKK
jgi:mono/diheme cytochrome c family protein